jgi:nitrogen fixation NifU-like protein
MDEMYHSVVLELSRAPRGYGELVCASADAREVNRVCGDSVHVFVRAEHGVVQEMSFTGRACALSIASTSLLTVLAQGKSSVEIAQMRQEMEEFLRSQRPQAPAPELQIFEGVRSAPSRIKCVLLGWNALQAALHEPSDIPTLLS